MGLMLHNRLLNLLYTNLILQFNTHMWGRLPKVLEKNQRNVGSVLTNRS